MRKRSGKWSWPLDGDESGVPLAVIECPFSEQWTADLGILAIVTPCGTLDVVESAAWAKFTFAATGGGKSTNSTIFADPNSR
jgi:hypothetical protein